MNSHRLRLHLHFLIPALILMAATAVVATPPYLLNYQGRLTNALGTPVPDGIYSVTFNLWTRADGGSSMWTETDNVATADGLFSVVLGEVTPLTFGAVYQPNLHLGIQIGAEPEMTPRTKLVSTPYTLSSAFVLDRSPDSTLRLYLRHIEPNSALLRMLNKDGHDLAVLREWDGEGGTLQLFRDDKPEGVEPTKSVQVGNSSGHTRFTMFDTNGDEKIYLDTDSIGDGAARLPIASISKMEITDEPGLAFNHNTSAVVLTGTVADIVAANATAPASGYYLVTGKGTAFLSGTSGTNYGYAQIDATAGGTIINPYRTVFGSVAMGTTEQTYIPFTVTRVFAVDAGTPLTFRLEGCYGGSQGSGAVIDVRNAMIQALFVPTIYGTATGLVSAEEATQFQNAVPVEVDGEIRYEVDLRELELRAAKAEAELLRAQTELERARRQELEARFQADSKD